MYGVCEWVESGACNGEVLPKHSEQKGGHKSKKWFFQIMFSRFVSKSQYPNYENTKIKIAGIGYFRILYWALRSGLGVVHVIRNAIFQEFWPPSPFVSQKPY